MIEYLRPGTIVAVCGFDNEVWLAEIKYDGGEKVPYIRWLDAKPADAGAGASTNATNAAGAPPATPRKAAHTPEEYGWCVGLDTLDRGTLLDTNVAFDKRNRRLAQGEGERLRVLRQEQPYFDSKEYAAVPETPGGSKAGKAIRAATPATPRTPASAAPPPMRAQQSAEDSGTPARATSPASSADPAVLRVGTRVYAMSGGYRSSYGIIKANSMGPAFYSVHFDRRRNGMKMNAFDMNAKGADLKVVDPAQVPVAYDPDDDLASRRKSVFEMTPLGKIGKRVKSGRGDPEPHEDMEDASVATPTPAKEKRGAAAGRQTSAAAAAAAEDALGPVKVEDDTTTGTSATVTGRPPLSAASPPASTRKPSPKVRAPRGKAAAADASLRTPTAPPAKKASPKKGAGTGGRKRKREVVDITDVEVEVIDERPAVKVKTEAPVLIVPKAEVQSSATPQPGRTASSSTTAITATQNTQWLALDRAKRIRQQRMGRARPVHSSTTITTSQPPPPPTPTPPATLGRGLRRNAVPTAVRPAPPASTTTPPAESPRDGAGAGAKRARDDVEVIDDEGTATAATSVAAAKAAKRVKRDDASGAAVAAGVERAGAARAGASPDDNTDAPSGGVVVPAARDSEEANRHPAVKGDDVIVLSSGSSWSAPVEAAPRRNVPASSTPPTGIQAHVAQAHHATFQEKVRDWVRGVEVPKAAAAAAVPQAGTGASPAVPAHPEYPTLEVKTPSGAMMREVWVLAKPPHVSEAILRAAGLRALQAQLSVSGGIYVFPVPADVAKTPQALRAKAEEFMRIAPDCDVVPVLRDSAEHERLHRRRGQALEQKRLSPNCILIEGTVMPPLYGPPSRIIQTLCDVASAPVSLVVFNCCAEEAYVTDARGNQVARHVFAAVVALAVPPSAERRQRMETAVHAMRRKYPSCRFYVVGELKTQPTGGAGQR